MFPVLTNEKHSCIPPSVVLSCQQIRTKGARAMALSPKKRISNARYNEKCDNFNLRPTKERGQQIRAAAAASGESLQGFCLKAIDFYMEHLEREAQKGGAE